MRYFFTAILCLAFLSGCQTQDVSSFWNKHSLDYSDIGSAEEQFADFAVLAASAPEHDAMMAMDVLFDKMKQDTVAYYIYTNWIDGSFYTILSPCRNATLYSKAVDRITGDGIMNPNECEPFLKKREWIQYNRKGSLATVPGLYAKGTRTLVLVLDLGCPSCREALEKLAADSQWDGLNKVAVGLGNGPAPDVQGWEYIFPENGRVVFDIQMTPVYFVIAADGTVESGYTPAL